MDEIPTCCLSVRRSVLDRHGPFAEGVYSSDSEFFWNLVRDGIRPLYCPAIRVAHINIDRFAPFARKQLTRGHHYASRRARAFSRTRRAAYVAGCPALPFMLFVRRLRQIASRRSYLSEMARVSPLVFLGMLLWSGGEMLGYLGVPPMSGRSEERAP
jgi:hypothetical protein